MSGAADHSRAAPDPQADGGSSAAPPGRKRKRRWEGESCGKHRRSSAIETIARSGPTPADHFLALPRRYSDHGVATSQETPGSRDGALATQPRGKTLPPVFPGRLDGLIAAAAQLHLVIGVTLSLRMGSSAAYQCSRNAYNCSDFRTRAEAQAAYQACGGRGNDVHRLDDDRDGLAAKACPGSAGRAWPG